MTQATGKAERQAAGEMIQDQAAGQPLTVGADKAYDRRDFVARCARPALLPTPT